MRVIQVKTQEQLDQFFKLKNRTRWEEAVANEFFWPLMHQESCRDEQFDFRRSWSFLLLNKGKKIYWDRLTEELASYEMPQEGVLQDEIRNFVLKVTLNTIFGHDNHYSLACKALKNFDRRIKLIESKDKELRSKFVASFSLEVSNSWEKPRHNTLMAIAKGNIGMNPGLGPFDDFIQHLISGFIITGTIQIADSVVHCLLSGKSFKETMIDYPVNVTVTREGENGEMYILHPQKLNKALKRKWIFGQGPRQCPAKTMAPKFVETLTEFYRKQDLKLPEINHTRSLAYSIPYSKLEFPKKSWLLKLQEYFKYRWYSVWFAIKLRPAVS